MTGIYRRLLAWWCTRTGHRWITQRRHYIGTSGQVEQVENGRHCLRCQATEWKDGVRYTRAFYPEAL